MGPCFREKLKVYFFIHLYTILYTAHIRKTKYKFNTLTSLNHVYCLCRVYMPYICMETNFLMDGWMKWCIALNSVFWLKTLNYLPESWRWRGILFFIVTVTPRMPPDQLKNDFMGRKLKFWMRDRRLSPVKCCSKFNILTFEWKHSSFCLLHNYCYW